MREWPKTNIFAMEALCCFHHKIKIKEGYNRQSSIECHLKFSLGCPNFASHISSLVIYLTRNLLHHMNNVVADKVYHVNKYVKWSFRKETRVWPPIGPPGIVEWTSASRNMGCVPSLVDMLGMSLKIRYHKYFMFNFIKISCKENSSIPEFLKDP